MDPIRPDRTVMPYDVVIIGAGPAGLSCAIRLKQLQPELAVCVLEKGAEIGAHLLSGAAFEPRALNELLPNWKELGAPLNTAITTDKFLFLTKKFAFRLPTPKQMHNQGNFIISLGEFGKFLGAQAEQLGVEIFAGFAASEILYHDEKVIGVATGDVGLNKQGEQTDRFMAGVEIHARHVVIAEGCRGSLAKKLQDKFNLRADCDPQTYGLGVKEIWEVLPEHHRKGTVIHSIGWPLDHKTYGGSFLYHYGDNLVSLGFITGLDYSNPTLSPFQEMQRWKMHPSVAKILKGGRRISYGARTISEGGFQSVPKLIMPGALIIGDSGGFLNVPKIKGNHTAMKSGMVAAEALVAHFSKENNDNICTDYPEQLEKSWLWAELKRERNIRPGFVKGLFLGLLNAAWETYIACGKSPWTLKNHADNTTLSPKKTITPIVYPKPDGILTFDRLSSVYLSNTNHGEHQPGHLKLRDPDVAVDINFNIFGGPEQFYCPAGVYEFVHDMPDGGPRLQINAQNCVHCKACDIKDPTQNIDWTTPEGGDGPRYTGM